MLKDENLSGVYRIEFVDYNKKFTGPIELLEFVRNKFGSSLNISVNLDRTGKYHLSSRRLISPDCNGFNICTMEGLYDIFVKFLQININFMEFNSSGISYDDFKLLIKNIIKE